MAEYGEDIVALTGNQSETEKTNTSLRSGIRRGCEGPAEFSSRGMYEKTHTRTWEAHPPPGHEYGMTVLRHPGETRKRSYPESYVHERPGKGTEAKAEEPR